jgi:hypothetical protein
LPAVDHAEHGLVHPGSRDFRNERCDADDPGPETAEPTGRPDSRAPDDDGGVCSPGIPQQIKFRNRHDNAARNEAKKDHWQPMLRDYPPCQVAEQKDQYAAQDPEGTGHDSPEHVLIPPGKWRRRALRFFAAFICLVRRTGP